jgi:hypothetical protein
LLKEWILNASTTNPNYLLFIIIFVIYYVKWQVNKFDLIIPLHTKHHIVPYKYTELLFVN